MPLIEDIEIALPFVAELPEYFQKEVAREMSKWVVKFEETQILTPGEQRKLFDLRMEELAKRLDRNS